MRRRTVLTSLFSFTVLLAAGVSPVRADFASGQPNPSGLSGLDLDLSSSPLAGSPATTPLLRLLYTANSGGRLHPCPT